MDITHFLQICMLIYTASAAEENREYYMCSSRNKQSDGTCCTEYDQVQGKCTRDETIMFWWALALGVTFLICIIIIGCLVSCQRERQKQQARELYEINGGKDERVKRIIESNSTKNIGKKMERADRNQ